MTAPSRLRQALLNVALLAYPRAFRERFGREIREDFRAHGDDGGWRSLAMHVSSGLAERVSAIRRWPLMPGRRADLYEPRGRRAMFWENLRSDIGHAISLARRRPMVTGLAVLALALGIGANSAIFTVVNGVLLQPLPYGAASDLVMIWSSNPREQKPVNVVSPANFLDYRAGVQDLADLEAFASFITSDQLQTDDGPERVLLVNAGARMFEVLQRQAVVGRAFGPGDENAVVLSYGYWQRRFGGDPGVVGRAFSIGGRMQTVVGVMPNDFVFPYATMLGPDGFTTRTGVDLWSVWIPEQDPFANRNGQLVRNVHYLAVIGRRRPEVSVQAIETRLAGVAAQLEQAYPASNKG